MKTRSGSRAVLSVVAGAAMVLGMVVTSASPAGAEEPFDPTTFTPDVVPTLESAQLVLPTPSVPEGVFDVDALAPPVAARERSPQEREPRAPEPVDFDRSAAEPIERDEFTNVYEVEPGITATEIGQTPLNAMNDEGDWVPVETYLSHEGDEWTTDAHPLDPSFAESAGGDAVYSISRDGYNIGFTLLDAADADFEREPTGRRPALGEQVAYEDVFENQDLTFHVNTSGVKSSIVLNEEPTPKLSSWAWRVEANALDLEVDEDGSILFKNRYGVVEFHMPVPVMWDSSGIQGVREPASENVTARVYPSGDDWILLLSADHEWLSDRDRVYPVTVDPDIIVGPNFRHAYRSDGLYRNDFVHLGNARAAGDTWWHSAIGFGYASLSGYQVTGAALELEYWSGYTGVQSGWVWDATCLGYSGCEGTYLSTYAVANGMGYAQDYNFQERLAYWVRQGQFSHYYTLHPYETSGVYDYKPCGACSSRTRRRGRR